MALPPLILRRPIAVRFVDAMAVVRTSGESAEWPALLRLAADSERQEGGLTAEAVRTLLPLPLPASRALLRQGVELGMLSRDGEKFRLTALGRACLRQDVGMDGHHGLFRFAVTDEPLLAGRQLLHVEERRDLTDLEETTLEEAADALHTEPDAFFSSVAQRGLLFSVLRTSAQMRPVPRQQDLTLMMEVEIRPGQDGPFNLRLTGQWREAPVNEDIPTETQQLVRFRRRAGECSEVSRGRHDAKRHTSGRSLSSSEASN